MDSTLSSQTADVLSDIGNGNVKAVFTDLDGTLVKSSLRVDVLSNAIESYYGVKIDPQELTTAANAAGSFSTNKIFANLGNQDFQNALKTKPDFADFEKGFLRQLSAQFENVISECKSGGDKSKILSLLPPGAGELLRECHAQGIPIFACTNAENPEIAKLTASIVETVAGVTFDGVMCNGMPIDVGALQKDLGQAVAKGKTIKADGTVDAKGKPEADMLVPAYQGARGKLYAQIGAKIAMGRKTGRDTNPKILFLGDQKSDMHAANALGNILRDMLSNYTMDFLAIAGTGVTEKQAADRKAQWDADGIPCVLNPLSIGEALKERAIMALKNRRGNKASAGYGYRSALDKCVADSIESAIGKAMSPDDIKSGLNAERTPIRTTFANKGSAPVPG